MSAIEQILEIIHTLLLQVIFSLELPTQKTSLNHSFFSSPVKAAMEKPIWLDGWANHYLSPWSPRIAPKWNADLIFLVQNHNTKGLVLVLH